ncbi:hypothetical protein APR50_44210 [Variovorax paradoxus]|nr:hypothetical protein APR50_44210 [Variovorax paradoxus]
MVDGLASLALASAMGAVLDARASMAGADRRAGLATAPTTGRCCAIRSVPGVSLVWIGRAQCFADGASKFGIAGSMRRAGVAASVAGTAGAGQRAAVAPSSRRMGASVAPQAPRNSDAHNSATRGPRRLEARIGIMKAAPWSDRCRLLRPAAASGVKPLHLFSGRANPAPRSHAYKSR